MKLILGIVVAGFLLFGKRKAAAGQEATSEHRETEALHQ